MNELEVLLINLIQNITNHPPKVTKETPHVALFKNIRLHTVNHEIQMCVPTSFKITNLMSIYNKIR